MQTGKRWNIALPSPAAQALADRLRTSPLIAQILINRGLVDADECARFLSPSLKYLHEPSLIPGITQAAARIVQAIHQRQKVIIYGDYDVDGITATATLWHAIRLLGGQAEYYIPHRLDEGYGLNSEAIAQICADGAGLIISVDCGITALAEADLARERGVDLIITDHHEWRWSNVGGLARPILPRAHTIVHPRLGPDGTPATCTYPNPNLCGSGVAFKLAWAIGQAHGSAPRVSDSFRSFLIEATALAALGTVADVVPLTGENRMLVHFGLGGLKESRLLGIRALIESAGLTGRKLDSYHVGFLLAPRLNACGRMGHAREAVEMLTTADAARAGEIATYLEQQNRQRQELEKQIFEQATRQVIELGMDKEDWRGIVLAAEGWHAGVIGIVASRIVGRFNKPTIMVSLSNGHGHGSGRSIPGFHLARALGACGEHLETHGGHEMAAGLRLQSGKLEQFRRAFREYAAGELTPEMLTPELRIDAVAALRQINVPLVLDLARLGPFGTANPRPLIACMNVELAAAPRRVGRSGDHLQFVVRQDGTSIKCIAFNHGHLFERLAPGARLNLAAEPTINEYNDRRDVQLEVKDVQLV
jgi:single-stranded-DNA-specific exonuclease